MAVFDMFKKKPREDDFLDLGDLKTKREGGYGPAGKDDLGLGSDQMPIDLMANPLPGMPSAAPSSFAEKDIEVLKEKMKALQMQIEALMQRVRLLEEQSQGKKEEALREKYGTSPPEAGWHY